MTVAARSRAVDLGIVRLRSLDGGSRTGGGNNATSVTWELREILRYCGDLHRLGALVESSSLSTFGSHEVVEHICKLVELGRIEVVWCHAGFHGAPSNDSEPVVLSADDGAPIALSPAAEDPDEPNVWSPETVATEAQVIAMVKAARSGTPFCEVCQGATAPPSTRPSSDVVEAAQIEALTRASSEGAAFCEVCSA